MSKKCIRAFSLFVVILMLFSALQLSVFAGTVVDNPMNTSDVETDLGNLGHDVSKYVCDSGADYISVIDFVEYGYAYSGSTLYYGLYVYVYNPCASKITSSQIQLQYKRIDGTKSSVQKYDLKVVDYTEDLTLYKFLISGCSGIAPYINRLNREYYISGIEYKNASATVDNAKECIVAGSWRFSGYQENFGRDGAADSTLYRTYDYNETVKTELHGASWFSSTSDLGADYRYEVSSVYFNIPDYYIDKYGNLEDDTSGLYSVQGEYYKYATNGIMLPDNTLSLAFQKLQNNDLSTITSYSNGTINFGPGFYKYSYKHIYEAERYVVYDVAYNVRSGSWHKNYITPYNYICYGSDRLNRLCNVLVNSNSYVNSQDFLSYYKSSGRNKFTSSNGLVGLNSDNFILDSNKILYDISVDDGSLNGAIKSYASGKNKESYFLDRLFNSELYVDEDGYDEIKPIVEIKNDIFTYFTDESISDEYFVMVDDVPGLESFYDSNKLNNHIYLMRFDVTPYYCPQVEIVSDEDGLTYGPYSSSEKTTGYYFEKAVYENFDILSFTFRNEHGGKMTVPVSCDPIDISGAIIPGNNTILDDPNNPGKNSDVGGGFGCRDLKTGWQLLIVVGSGLLALFVLNVILKYFGKPLGLVFTGVRAIITAPFKLGAKAADKISITIDKKFDRDNKKYDQENKKANTEYLKARTEKEKSKTQVKTNEESSEKKS